MAKHGQRAKSKLFEVGFKGYYRETAEHFAEHVRAHSPQEALGKFGRMKKIEIGKLVQIDQTQWWEDEWLMSLRYVREVMSIPCPHCEGSGVTMSPQQ